MFNVTKSFFRSVGKDVTIELVCAGKESRLELKLFDNVVESFPLPNEKVVDAVLGLVEQYKNEPH